MVRIRNASILALSSLYFITALSGCSPQAGSQADGNTANKAGENEKAGTMNFDPNLSAQLSIYTDLGMTDEWFERFIIAPVRKKFPNITLEVVRKQKGTNPDELVIAGTFPDILYNSTPRLTQYKDLNLLYDMRELIKKHHFDLNSLNQPALDAIKQWGDKGELYGLPFWVNFSALYYNKDIFDRFGVPYPKDGMTWDEVIELSKSLTRNEGGVAYRGLDIHSLNDFYSQLSLPYVDAQTDKPLLETEGFKKVYETMMKLYKIPGNEIRKPAKDAFLKDKNLAMWPMYADVPTLINDLELNGDPFNWDMAQMPSFPDSPGVAWQADSHNLHVTNTSKNKEAAFQVIMYLLSQEPQMELVKSGLLSSSADPEMNKRFGESIGVFKGKHLDAILKSKPAPKYTMSKYDSIASGEFNAAFKNVESGAKDINTALREANEAAEKRIQEKKATQK
ncbi:hypothetical protein GCM10023310_64580 [Paenibacillus vulneris]|uniref:ABC transporter substrate-binding protein n=1 Tax=Paenibacillus vulneris TaxID=1133364 RepID=A0ABW3UWM0_9BACL